MKIIMQSCLSLCLLIITFISTSASQLTLYTMTYPPFADCTEYTAADSSSVFGAEIQLIRSALTFLDWTEGVDYGFECVSNLSTLLSTLDLNQTSNIGIVGGISISSQRFLDAYMFSQPTTSRQLPLVYKKTSKGWFFRRALDPTSWAILVATVFIMGGLLYFLENRETAYINMVYNAFCQFFLAPDYKLSYFASKTVHYFSVFLVTLVVIAFTAASTNIFQNDRNYGNTISLENLQNEIIYTNQVLISYLEQYGVKGASIGDSGYIDFVDSIENLGINYLAVDGPFSDFLIKQHCDFYAATNALDLIYYGAMFPTQFSRAVLNEISLGIIKAQQLKEFEDYVAEYYESKANLALCNQQSVSQNQPVSFSETIGLWYILAASFTAGVGFVFINHLCNIVKKNLRVYGLKGIRAKMDRKVQRRTATIFAIHAAVSIQAIGFLKRLNKEALNNWLDPFKSCFNDKVLLRTYKQFSETYGQEQKVKEQDILNDSQSGTFGRLSHALDWLKRSSILKGKSSTFASKQRQSASQGRASGLITDPTSAGKKKISRSSTLLKQSMLSYKLGNQLNQKIEAFSDDELVKEIEIGDKTKKKSTRELECESPVSDNKTGQSLEHRRISMLQRICGKKGIKVNKQMEAAAKTLLASKETLLLQEIERKKSEIISNNSQNNSPLLIKSLRLSLLSNTNTNYQMSPFRTSIQRTIAFGLNSPVADDGSPRFAMNMPSIGFDSHRLHMTHLKSSNLIVKNQSRMSLLGSASARRVSENFDQVNSVTLKIPAFGYDEEECNFHIQNEAFAGVISPENNIARYDFSQIVQDKGSKTNRGDSTMRTARLLQEKSSIETLRRKSE